MDQRRRSRRRPKLEDDGGVPGAVLWEEGTGRSWHGEHTRVRSEKREERSRGAWHFTDGGMLRRPAMAAASTSRGDGVRKDGERCGRGEKGGVGLGRDFYRAGRGIGKRRLGQSAIDGHGGRPGHEGIQRGRSLMEKKLKGVKEGE
jgi:hypothetical protein